MPAPGARQGLEVRGQSMPCRGLPGVCGWCEAWWRGPLAGVAASCAAEAAQASEAVAEGTGGDGHSLGAEDGAHGSG